MREVIVSIRMPRSMADELRILAKKNHFLDISEEIRTVIREKIKENEEQTVEVKRMISDIKDELSSEKEQKRKVLVESLKKILEDLEHE
jgi:Arc/MetJ-type ribon-helix-helix transcriptional regulator